MSRISRKIRRSLDLRSGERCGYCRSPQKYLFAPLEIEHILPQARGGTSNENNLWLACRLCNGFKGTSTHGIDPVSGRITRLFDPRRQKWSRHFRWSDDFLRIIGITACGRVTVAALQLNNRVAMTVRQSWASVGWLPLE